MEIRPGEESDLADLVELYNHYIRETAITFDLDPYTLETRRPWFDSFGTSGRHRLFVAVAGRKVIGYASSGVFRPKAAYAPSVETSIYLAPGAIGNGTGRALYQALFNALQHEDVHRAYAGITLPNEASIAIHRRFGFEPIGVFTHAGRKFDRYWDVAWYEKRLDD